MGFEACVKVRLMFLWALTMLLCSCMSNQSLLSLESQETVGGLSVSRQKQRILLLQKKLEIAEGQLHAAQNLVDLLSRELQQSQLALITRQVQMYEQQKQKSQSSSFKDLYAKFHVESDGFFLKEREVLEAMMENGPSPESSEAQIVLDKVLRLITETCDAEGMGI